MPKKPLKNATLPPVRIDTKLKKELEAEAGEMGLDLSAYIRYLLVTDPRRKKK